MRFVTDGRPQRIKLVKCGLNIEVVLVMVWSFNTQIGVGQGKTGPIFSVQPIQVVQLLMFDQSVVT